MSPAAGGATAPTQPTAASAALAPAPMIAAPGPDRAAPPPPMQEKPRDPSAQIEGADPGNAATRKTAWNVPPPPAAPVGGIMGGDASWPALAESARAWPKSASSDSLKSLSDGSAPSAPEDLIVPSLPLQPVSNLISTAPSPTSTSPPPNATAAASSRQNGGTNQPNLVRHGGNNGVGSGGDGSSDGRSTGNNSSDGNSGRGGDGNCKDGGFGGGSNLNSSVHHSAGISGSGIDSSRRVFGNNNWNGYGRGGGSSNNNGTGNDDGSNRNSGGSGGRNPWNNNARNGGGSSNGFGGRGGRNRRDHERGVSFAPRNYPRAPLPPQQQQPSIYQHGPFHRALPPPPPAHFMVPQPFVPYVPPFAYPADVQAYPFYITPVEQQFQNMHLVRQPMQPLWVHQGQLSVQEDIRQQIEFYFSTNNLCHDTYLRRHMDDQGWVPIDLLAGFPMMRRFTMLGVDTNYILDAIRGSEILEVQGNNVRRRNDWAEWLLH